EREDCRRHALLQRPSRRIAVTIGRPDEDEAESDGGAEQNEALRPLTLFASEQRTERIARRHHADPGDEWVANEHLDARIELQQPGLMQDVPDPSEAAELVRLDTVQDVVPGDHDNADRGDGPAWKKHKAG